MFKKTPQFLFLKYAFVIATSLFFSLLAEAQITKPQIIDSTLQKMDEVQLKNANARTEIKVGCILRMGYWSLLSFSAKLGVTQKRALTKKKSSTIQLFYDLLNNQNLIKYSPWC